MPIRDRSNRRLIRLGFIRLGHKEKGTRADGSTYEYPVQDDHFLLHDAPEIEKFYHEQGIDKVRELDVLLPFPDIDRNFPTWYQVWAGGVLVCQGDGEYVDNATPFTANISTSRKGVQRTSVRNAPGDTLVNHGVAQSAFDWGDAHFEAGEHVPCPGAAKGMYPHCAACKLSSVLKVMMADPELFRLGYYQISTGSGKNYDTIMGTLEVLPADRVNGYPFKLRLVEEQTSYQDTDGQRKKTDKWFLQLEPDPEITRQLYLRQTSRMLGAPEPRSAPMLDDGMARDWGFDSEDAPGPPPYAEDQMREPYEDETPTGDPLLNGDLHGAPMDADASEDHQEVLEDESKPPAPVELVPAPNGVTHRDLAEKAVGLDGYENIGQVKAAMLDIYGKDWARSTEWSPTGAWLELQVYAAARPS